MKSYVLALDQGTSSSRACIIDERSNVISTGQKEILSSFPNPGWVEQDALAIWASILSVMAEALEKGNIKPEQIKAIGITNQRETTVVWNVRTGQPIYQAIVWQSRQSKSICDTLKAQGLEPLFQKQTGLVLDPYFSGTKIACILHHVPGAREQAKRGELRFGTIDSWILWKLTGHQIHATDVSNASRTLLMNIHTLTWDETLLNHLSIPRSMLPTILPSSHLFGYTQKELFFNQAIPISGIAGDQQAALFGQGCVEPGMVKNTYGTGCFMLMNTGSRPVMSKHGLLTTVAWQIGNEVTYALEGSIFVAGSSVQWLRDSLHFILESKDSEQLALSVSSSDGVYVVPAFVGLGAPYWDSDAKGAMFGLTRGTQQAHLVRATLESIAYQTKDVLLAMEEDTHLHLKTLKVDGGACANDFLMQFQADILNTNVVRPNNIESTVLGAAYLAGLAVGFWKSIHEVNALQTQAKTFIPLMKTSLTNNLYQGWKIAIEATRKFKLTGLDNARIK
jgi:glycerol kinase